METTNYRKLINESDSDAFRKQLIEKIKTISGIDAEAVELALATHNPVLIIRGNDIVIANHSLPGFFGVLADFDEAHEAVAVN